MILIPAGWFWMGAEGRYTWESPRHRVFLDSFWIAETSVTRRDYQKFLDTTGHELPRQWNDPTFGDPDQPVVGVNWFDAVAYCEWYSQSIGESYRLPTEAEWEKAARGVDGRLYPWGNNAPTASLANFGKDSAKPATDNLAPVTGYESGKSPYGIQNLAVNVAEWVADWYDEGFPKSAVWNPTGPASGKGKVLRGGGWSDAPGALSTARRFYVSPEDRADDRGFR